MRFVSKDLERSVPILMVLLAGLILMPAVNRVIDPANYMGTHENKSPEDLGAYDPLAKAIADGLTVANPEATVPVQCYTKTEGVANPCWTCHTEPQAPNEWVDWDLQESYAFSDFALTNRWTNLFVDRREEMKAISDRQALAYIRQDNYQPLRDALATRKDYPGYKPDLDFNQGFDREGFANDGSQWRAFTYKPFPGTFWPTNGNTDDVMIRLPKVFQTLEGKPNREIYKINLSLLEMAIASPPEKTNAPHGDYPVEPLSEMVAGIDLNGDKRLSEGVETIAVLPKNFVGDAAHFALRPYVYPLDTEFLHSVRYVDPDRQGKPAIRMKELRYAKKVVYLDSWATSYVYEREYNEKEEGSLPTYAGSPLVGLRNTYGWQLQGFIEDAEGRLRLQNMEEHQFCMGCHGSLSITVDHTFALPRKLPGAKGWRYQNLQDMKDVPQFGMEDGEILTYLKRVGGGDEFRANEEILERFFKRGVLDEAAIRQAGIGGKKDLNHLIFPSRKRAITLNKAYMALVKQQQFEFGRDVIIDPINKVHRSIENGTTDLGRTNKIFRDGRIWLDWRGIYAIIPETEK